MLVIRPGYPVVIKHGEKNVEFEHFQKGTPWKCSLFTVLYTCSDSFCLAHLPMGMVCHYCATIDNFCLASLQWLNQTKQTKNQKNKKKMTRPNSLPLLPPWGVQSCSFLVFFVFFWFLGFLVSCFLVPCWWFQGLAKQHKSEGPRPNSLPVLPL